MKLPLMVSVEISPKKKREERGDGCGKECGGWRGVGSIVVMVIVRLVLEVCNLDLCITRWCWEYDCHHFRYQSETYTICNNFGKNTFHQPVTFQIIVTPLNLSELG